jgi:predicted benzoate:H+ symporter BenE
MKPLSSSPKHPHAAFRWWAALVGAVLLLLASLAAGALRTFGWF